MLWIDHSIAMFVCQGTVGADKSLGNGKIMSSKFTQKLGKLYKRVVKKDPRITSGVFGGPNVLSVLIAGMSIKLKLPSCLVVG